MVGPIADHLGRAPHRALDRAALCSDPSSASTLTVDLVEKLGQDIVLLVQAAGGLIGTIMTILGRMRATTLLERRPVKLKL